jgi:hypothetical protein
MAKQVHDLKRKMNFFNPSQMSNHGRSPKLAALA